jgi:ATP-dependent Clp endopeptidase proteolytic subunit ClpP
MNNSYWGNNQLVPTTGEPKQNKEIMIHEPAIMRQVNNRIYFYAEIDRANILQLNQAIRDQSHQLQHMAKIEGRDPSPIFLHINSYGGSIFHGLAAMDEILNCGINVITIIDGCCASAGTFLSIVGKKRFINKHAFMLIHQLSSFMWGKYEEFKDEMTNQERLMKMIKDIYNEYTKVPEEKLEEILKHDLWFDAETCLKYSLVDKII